MGTGPYLEPDYVSRPMVIVPRPGSGAPVLIVEQAASGDSRDLIDHGLDVLLTWDRRAVEYAATRAELRATPLPTDRAYLLLTSPQSADSAASFRLESDPRWATLRASLTRDVVRGAAPATEPWWATRERLGGCAIEAATTTIGPTPPATPTRRIVYPSDDRLAGELAQRLVALTAYDRDASGESDVLRERIPQMLTGSDRPIVAAGLRGRELSRALATGADLAYLVVVPRRPLDACASWRELAMRAPWVSLGSFVMLAEAGPTLITGPRAPAMTVDWDNTLRFAPPPSPSDPR
jgi:hypothetical protein